MPITPELSNAGLEAAVSVTAINEFGETINGHIAAERALTISSFGVHF